MNPENSLSSQMKFIILCCKSEIDENDIKSIRESVAATVNLEDVSMLAYGHGVYPLFYHTLMEYASDLLDQEMRDAMAYLFQSIKISNENMTNELIRLTKLFGEHDIDVLSLKGPVLAKMAYGDVSLRQYSDLDVFCKKQDFRKIATILIANDYNPPFSIEKFEDKAIFELNHDVLFINREKGIALEAHFQFYERYLFLPTEKFKPWASVKSTNIYASTLNTLSDETHFLFLATHGNKHFWEKTIWIVDIDRMIRYSINLDWNSIISRAKKLGVLKILLSSLMLARQYFNTPLPSNIIDMANNLTEVNTLVTYFDKLILNSEKAPASSSLKRIYKYSRMRDSLILQILTFLLFIFSPTQSERKLINLPDKLFFLYWPVRFFTLISKNIFAVNK